MAAQKLRFKKGLQLTDEITVSLPAGDWISIMTWIDSHDTDGINYLLYPMMMEQLGPEIYDAPSFKAAEAQANDQPKTLEDLLRQQFPTTFGLHGPFVVVCDTCGDRDEYPALPMGPLTCGHDGPRHGIAEA